MAEEQTSQTVAKPVPDAPVEPNIDSLLQNIPDLKAVFADSPGQPEQTPKEGASIPEPEAPETAAEIKFEIPEGLKPEEEEKPPSEPKKEEPDKVQKRIDELTAKRKAAEERVSSLETELADLKSKFQAPPQIAPNPTVEVSIDNASGPRPNTRSANPGNSSTKPRVPIVVIVNSSSIGAMPGWRLA